MTFPCLICCGELPIVEQQPQPTPVSTAGGVAQTNSSSGSGGNDPKHQNQQQRAGTTVGVGGGTTIRTLSKDVSDKIFQNLCKQLSIKSDPSWLMQNPGEQMPLCAACSAAVLEVYTLQTKVDHFTMMIKKQVLKLERIVADTEIATNWMATKSERESEEEMWKEIGPKARERHDKFRSQILQNFKNKVKQRMKLRAAGQTDYDLLDADVTESAYQIPALEPINFENGDRFIGPGNAPSSSTSTNNQYSVPFKRLKTERTATVQQSQRSQPIHAQTSSPSTSTSAGLVGGGMNFFKNAQKQSSENKGSPQPTSSLTSSFSRARINQEFHDEDDMSDEHETAYPDVQIVCTAGPVDYDVDYKDEYSGDGEESMEQDGSVWYTGEDNMEEEEAMTIPDGEEVVWLSHNVVLRKCFLEQLLIENLKPSVFLRKLMFAVFGLKQIANSSGTTGSNKPGAKPSLDRQKFEALRDYTIDTYGIRDNLQELDDLNRKIRTICCDARKALKRKAHKPATQQSFDGFGNRRTDTSTNSDDFAEVSGIPTEEVIQMSMNSGNDAMQERSSGE